MNKREYKKAVEALGSGMCIEIFNIGATEKNVDAVKMQQAMSIVWNAMENTKRGANIFFDKRARDFENHLEYKKAKAVFFKNLFERLNSEFESKLEEALKLVNEAAPTKD